MSRAEQVLQSLKHKKRFAADAVSVDDYLERLTPEQVADVRRLLSGPPKLNVYKLVKTATIEVDAAKVLERYGHKPEALQGVVATDAGLIAVPLKVSEQTVEEIDPC